MTIRSAGVFFWIAAVFLVANCFGQDKMKRAERKDDPDNYRCYYRPKFSAKERMKNYPFNVAAQVVLTSYELDFMAKKEGTPDLERIVLSKIQIDSLTDLLFNNFYKGEIWRIEGVGCFQPRNAIVFVDAAGKEFERADVCFECLNYHTGPTEFKFGDDCKYKMSLLDPFFASCGIKIGPRSNKPREQH
ncbi:hypothetical protein SAMN04488109_1925 [Chryseolinea serpens]|uniref:Uncharacterized protein n=1 Tax=Chryseolinea serpens TaxID=947013 RepID=A0A1M5MT20_9BACT|nr:hypothetical protein [Chryseolinea serpens]SHG80514.1 hypothetical protein SAMN04488109_1925 [Chryseolinea serpens]